MVDQPLHEGPHCRHEIEYAGRGEQVRGLDPLSCGGVDAFISLVESHMIGTVAARDYVVAEAAQPFRTRFPVFPAPPVTSTRIRFSFLESLAVVARASTVI